MKIQKSFKQLQQDVTIVFLRKLRVIGNDVMIIEQKSMLLDSNSIVSPVICRISIPADGRVIAESSWILPIIDFTFGLLHAMRFPIKYTTRAMKHEFDDGFVQ